MHYGGTWLLKPNIRMSKKDEGHGSNLQLSNKHFTWVNQLLTSTNAMVKINVG
jgi:hypothetical protein